MSGESPTRVLVVYGSEGGTAQRGIAKIAKSWTAQSAKESAASGEKAKFTVGSQVSGNSISTLESLKDRCDVLVISTSSFGEGDPPANFNLLLLKLFRAAAAGEKPLAGLQHVVLGYGCSVYPTFQNCPRMADKLMGECGSRRLEKRVELDDGGEEDPVDGMRRFDAAVFAALSGGLPNASSPPVCDWRVPASKLEPKTEEDLLMDMGEGGSNPMLPVILVAGLGVAAAAAWQFGMF